MATKHPSFIKKLRRFVVNENAAFELDADFWVTFGFRSDR